MTVILVSIACAAGALIVAGAAEPPPSEPSYEIAVGAAAGKKEVGSDLEVFVGDQRVESVERLTGAMAGPLRVVLYLDYPSARPASVQALSTALVEQSERLASIPGLEIVAADPDPQPMPRWRSREELEQIASRLALRDAQVDEIEKLRSEFLSSLAELELEALSDQPAPPPGQPGPIDAETARSIAEEAHRLEIEQRRERQDALLSWVAAQGRAPGRRLLLLLDDNLALDPAAFYRSRLTGAAVPTFAGAAPSLDSLSATLASYGWTLFPIVPDPAEAERRLRYSPSAETPVGFRLGLGKKRDDAEPGVDLGLVAHGLDAVEGAARRTGGERLADLATLSDRIVAFGARPVLRFRAPELPVGELRPLSVRSSGGDVLAPEVIASGTPIEIAALRARRAVGGETVEGGLVVRSAIEFDPDLVEETTSRYEATVDLADLRKRRAGLERASFRVTLAIHVDSGEVLIKHDVMRDVELRGRDEWVQEGDLRLPSETDGAVVLVELLETGDWGDSFAAFVRRRSPSSSPESTAAADAPRAGAPRPGTMLPAARMVRLVPPDRNVVYGRSRIRAEVDARVKRLVYMLDGKRVATRRGEPWEVLLDLGDNPRQRMLVAIAYGPNDVELGRDGLLLNDAARGFGVRIVEPRSGRRAGPVDVEAAVDLPQGATLDRVEFYWMDQLVSTVRRPPFRQRLFIPVSSSAGFIRVAARLVDGRAAEDVVMMNADRFEEQVTVNLVELYVVVTDRAGKPVRDLDASDFTVLENGLPQRVETFSRAGELPITVGLALDSSLSMFVQMPALQQAAASFVDGLIEQRDQAFLIGFGNQPTVVSAATGDLNHVIEGIRSLEPTGNTAVWEGVVLSMLQLQEVAGRKALVVFYDGDDEDEDFSFTTSLKMAEKVGVPVYLIVMNNALARSGPSGFTTKHRAERLERMARTGGGKVYYVSTEADLGEIFTSIRDELRAHYLLTYYPDPLREENDEGGGGETAPSWRPIEVRVGRPGLT
ncbi:MAG TPA: VWA domain-containing protein, partial [Thermoanaerobaculia bacterium]|nr:VWA domain-containing protein [Thermoanaerobaculia bacterium]